MTIALNGYPGRYRGLTPWLSAFLSLELDASPACLKVLDTWMTGPDGRTYPDWRSAVAAAVEELGEQHPGVDLADFGAALVRVVLHATRIAQDLYSLTGGDAANLAAMQADIASDCDELLRAAAAAPAAARRDVGASDLDGYLEKSGSPRRYRDGERDTTLMLVRHPWLVVNRPAVVPPGRTDSAMLRTSLLALTREARRISATARLDVTVGTTTDCATFIANSGQDIVEYRHTEPHPSRTGTVEHIERLTVAQIYQAFPATAGRDSAPTPRHRDAEKKIFDLIHTLLVAACRDAGVGMHEVTGTLAMATGIRMCPSCYLVALQFLSNFPQIQITVSRVE